MHTLLYGPLAVFTLYEVFSFSVHFLSLPVNTKVNSIPLENVKMFHTQNRYSFIICNATMIALQNLFKSYIFSCKLVL